MPRPHNERRPQAGDLRATKSTTATGSLSIVDDLDEIARHVDGTFVVVVKVTGDKYRRRCYLSAAAAQRAARRATERGEAATVYMAELRPLWRVEAEVVA